MGGGGDWRVLGRGVRWAMLWLGGEQSVREREHGTAHGRLPLAPSSPAPPRLPAPCKPRGAGADRLARCPHTPRSCPRGPRPPPAVATATRSLTWPRREPACTVAVAPSADTVVTFMRLRSIVRPPGMTLYPM